MANRISLDGQVFQPETRYSQTTGKPVTVQQSAEDPAAGAPIPDEEIPF